MNNLNLESMDIDFTMLDKTSDIKLEIIKIDKKIKNLIEYRNDLKNLESISERFAFNLLGVDEKLKFYEKMEEQICSSEKGLEFWNNVKKIITEE